MYAYVGSDPISLIDPTGDLFIPGAIGGAIGGFAGSVGGQLYNSGGNLSCVSLGQAGKDALAGAAMGSGAGLLASIFRKAAATLAARAAAARGLGTNPFKGKTADELAQMLAKKGYVPRDPAPISGRGNYVNPNTGRGYHIDSTHPLPKGPHVGVQRPRDVRDILSPRDYPM